MQKPSYHLMVCNSFRLSGEPQGVCNKNGAVSLLQYLENEIVDRGIDAQVTSTGCLKVCDRGPAMVIYPQGTWYGHITKGALDKILDALEVDGEVPEYML